MSMKRILALIGMLVIVLSIAGCSKEAEFADATKYGVSPSNSAQQNSENLQKLIDELSVSGGTVYIPAGVYEFAENGTQTIGSHCIKMRSNVSITGDGEKTVLKPVGASQAGMDMFYFNDYLDTGKPIYLENCRFEDFVIDAADTSCETYTSAGKGFMFNLFRHCHWRGVTVRNTDATGFGVDCPINSSISSCTAIGCGKAATVDNGGASGFGIGYGYCAEESMTISDCRAEGNKKFGFFFEHQGRFNSTMYTSEDAAGFRVLNCTAQDNLYNFGGIVAFGGVYEGCTSERAVLAGCYFEDCSDFEVKDCLFRQSKAYDILIDGGSAGFILTGNMSDRNQISLGRAADDCVNTGNSWNEEPDPAG